MDSSTSSTACSRNVRLQKWVGAQQRNCVNVFSCRMDSNESIWYVFVNERPKHPGCDGVFASQHCRISRAGRMQGIARVDTPAIPH